MTPQPSVAARLHAFDVRVFERVAEMQAPALDRVLPKLSEAASYSRLWMATAALLAIGGGKKGRRVAVEALLAVGATSAIANITMKQMASRRRPQSSVPERRRLAHPASSSFPSGHSASAAVFSGVVSAEFPGLRLPMNGLAGSVAFSRVYCGVHYPGDVLAGWLIGKTVAAGTVRIARRTRVGR